MGKYEFKINLTGNPAKNFEGMVANLRSIAEERKVPVQEVIKEFITDIQNLGNEEYKKKVDEIDIHGGISESIKRKLIPYLRGVIKRYDDSERRNNENERRNGIKEARQKVCDTIYNELQALGIDEIKAIILNIENENAYSELDGEQRKYLLKKLNALLGIKEKKALDESKRLKRVWGEINSIVEKNTTTTQSKLKYWKWIRDNICGGEDMPFTIPKSVFEQTKLLIEGKIEETTDLLYYEQVKNFTSNFSFLRDPSEIARAYIGYSDKRFTDLTSYDRFLNLREQLQNGYDEYSQINIMLAGDKISKIDRRILEERLVILRKEREFKGYPLR